MSTGLDFEKLLQSRNNVEEVCRLVDRFGADFVVGEALKYQRAKEANAYRTYEHERDRMRKSCEAANFAHQDKESRP